MITNLAPILCAMIGSILGLIDLALLHGSISRIERSSSVAAFGLIRMMGQAICLAALIKPFGPWGLASGLIAWSLMRVIYLRHLCRDISS